MSSFEDKDSIIEAIYGGAPAHLLSMFETVGEPEYLRKARAVGRDPRKIRSVPVSELENVLHRVVQVSGLRSVHAALSQDRRKRARDLILVFPEPIETTQDNGLPMELDVLVAELLTTPTRHAPIVFRDLFLRLDDLRRHELVDAIAMVEEPNFPRSYVKDTLVQACSRCAMDGLLHLDRLNQRTRILLVGSGMSSMPGRYERDHILETLRDGTDRRVWESTMLALWGGARPDLTEGILAAWRGRVWADKSMSNEVAALLAMREAMTEKEVRALTKQGRDHDICSILSGSGPEQCELILLSLPEDFRLRDVSDALEHASSLSDQALCALVRCGEGLDIIRWLRRPKSSTSLRGERGKMVAETILSHWRDENIHILLGELASYRYEIERGDVAHLALHASGVSTILKSSGSLGTKARNHLYENFGRDAAAWAYCLELAPSWAGSVDQLASAGRKLSRGAGLRSGAVGGR